MKIQHLNKIKLMNPSLLIFVIVASLFSVNVFAIDEVQENKLSEEKAQLSTNAARIYVDK